MLCVITTPQHLPGNTLHRVIVVALVGVTRNGNVTVISPHLNMSTPPMVPQLDLLAHNTALRTDLVAVPVVVPPLLYVTPNPITQEKFLQLPHHIALEYLQGGTVIIFTSQVTTITANLLMVVIVVASRKSFVALANIYPTL